MKIAELFVNLGITGADKTQNTLGKTKNTLGELTTSGLAAKAAIVGMVYGLERLMMNSSQTGATLMSYASATGLSAENLQRWQYAAAQANVGAEEMEGALTGLQSAMVKMAMGQGVPSGFGVISNAVGIDPSKIRDTLYMMDKLNEYAKTETNVDFANEQLKSFGLSLNMISAMRRDAFNAKNLGAAPIYSDAEAGRLQKVNVAWSNLGRNFEMAIGHLTAKHGLSLVKDISGVSKEVLKLITSFVNLAEKINLLKNISDIFKGWGLIFELIIGAVDKVAGFVDDTKPGEKKRKGEGGITGWANKRLGGFMDSFFADRAATQEMVSPKIATNPNKVVADNNTTVTVHNHGVKDAQEATGHMKREIQHAARQRSAIGEAN